MVTKNSLSTRNARIQSTTSHRLTLLQLCVYCAFLVVLGRLFYWQVFKREELQAIAEAQYTSVTNWQGKRGSIYTSDGHLLVGNKTVYTLFAQPQFFKKNPSEIAHLLFPYVSQQNEQTASPSADQKPLTLQQLQEKLANSERKWIPIKTEMSEEQKKAIDELKLPGIGFDAFSVRTYPEASLAAHVVGFVGRDAQGDRVGYFGIEGQLDRELQGQTAVVKRKTDAQGQTLEFSDSTLPLDEDGRDVTLTIRRDIQYMIEKKLMAGMSKYGAVTGEVVVMEPQTGNILGMSSFPNYDPEHYNQYPTEWYKNPLVAEGYEPGSTFKVLTVAAGIDAGIISPDTVCTRCASARQIAGYTIKTWNDEYTPNITIRDGLAKSDNTAMIFVAEELGTQRFIEYLEKFQIGKPSGIELQEDSSTLVREHWQPIDLATSSFGQGIATTGLQMVKAVGAIANHGNMMRPKILNSVDVDGKAVTIEPEVLGQPISAKTASIVSDMMVYAASKGEAQWTASKKYTIAGKTGTAQIPVAGHYDEDKTIASFIGFAPASDPKFVMLVKLREPQSSQWASETAAPLWYDIANELFIILNILPDRE